MIEGYYEMIAAFLSDYVLLATGDSIPPDPKWISQAIRLVMRNGTSKDEIKRAAIRDAGVIIRDDLFPREE